MLIMDGSDQAAVHDLYEVAAYADLGTVTPHLTITRPRATVVYVRVPPRYTMSTIPPAKWSWSNAPPRRAA